MLRRLFLLLGGVLATVLLLVIGAFAYAQTSLGKQQIADVVAGQLSAPGQQAEVKALGGFLPFDIHLGELRLRDDEGVWLAADNVRVELAPAALLKGEITVKQVGAERIALERLPPPGPEEPEPASEEPFSLPKLPELPESLAVVAIERLFVDTLGLGAPVLGEAATFTLNGSATTGPEGRQAEARLSLRRTDEVTAALDLAAGLDLATRRLDLDLKGSETGGLLAAATGRPEAGALRLSLNGSGPLSDWQGRLTAEAERLAKLDLGVDLAYADQPRLALEGTFDAAEGALPAEIADVVGTRAELLLRAGEVAPQRFAIQDLKLQAASLSLNGTGSADLGADTVQGSINLDVPDLARFAGLAGLPLDGKAALRLQAEGTARQPKLRLTLEGTDLVAAQAALQRLEAAFDVGFLAPLGEAPVSLRVAGEARTAGLAVNGRTLGPDGQVVLELAGELPAEGRATLQTLALRSALLDVTGEGAVDRDTLAGAARLQAIVPELSEVASAFAPDAAALAELAGAFQLGADIRIGPQAQRIEVALSGAGENLRGLPPGGMELIGPAPKLTAKAVVEPGKAAVVQSLMIEGEGVRLDGDPRYGLADQSLGGGIRVSLPELRRLEAVASQPLAGSLALQADLGGTVEQPTVTLDGTVQDLAVAGQSFDRITLEANAAGPADALAGSARLAAIQGEQQVSLRSDYRLADQTLSLSGLMLAGPATQLGGDLQVALDTLLARGRLAGGVEDLGALQPWTGQKLAGSVKLDLGLSAPDGRQDARLQLDADNVAGDFGRLQSARLEAEVEDALRRQAVDATLRAQDFTAPDLALDEAVVEIDGTPAELAVVARAAGSQAGQPFNLKADATLALMEPRRSVRLSSIEGTLAGQNAKLMRPATIVLDQGVLVIDQLDLRLGPARAQGSLRYGDGRIRAGIDLDRLPLDLLKSFGGPELAGTATGRLALTGPLSAPQGELRLDIARLALGANAPATLDLGLNGTLKNGRIAADARLSGLGAEPLTATLAMPLGLSLEPVAFSLADNAPLDGSVRGRIELTRAQRFAVLDGLQIRGDLDVGLGIGGTLAAPRLDGGLDLKEGQVQDVATGISLRDLRLAVRAEGDRLVISELSARDRADGRLAGRGTVTLLGQDGVGYDVAVNLARARVLDNSLGIVLLSGDLALAGDTERAKADGRLQVEQAEIAIPDGGGADVAVIAVREVYGDEEISEPASMAKSPFEMALDIGIKIPARLYVRGRGLESEWQGDLVVKGEASEPLVTGELEFRRGHLDLLEQRFAIEQGKIYFTGTQPPVPTIDLVASTQTADVKAIIKVQGPATDPRIELDSEPKLPQDEVLSRILFGRAVARITPVQGLRLAAAVRELQGGGGFDALTSLRRAIGIDTLDVDGGAAPGEASARAGKYLSDNVYLEVERGVAEGSGKARVQVELTPNLSVGTEVTEGSQTGVGLQWRYDY